jgi:hypothetical protein
MEEEQLTEKIIGCSMKVHGRIYRAKQPPKDFIL